MGIYEGAEKVLAAAHHRDAGVVGKSYCAHARICGRTVHLHVVLVSDVGIGTEISVPIVNEDSCAEIFVLAPFRFKSWLCDFPPGDTVLRSRPRVGWR